MGVLGQKISVLGYMLMPWLPRSIMGSFVSPNCCQDMAQRRWRFQGFRLFRGSRNISPPNVMYRKMKPSSLSLSDMDENVITESGGSNQ